MADKKKKDPSTPRRPVILRSDREGVKEPVKEKTEKEKQPTIILKTREQSASKEDRPVSPKAQAESDRPHAPKIAHNENKDRREPKTSQPCKPMTQPVKLVDENLEFNNAAMEFLNDSNSNYLVVGIIGMQGVGKSMILNLLNKNIPYETLCSDILKSYNNVTHSESEFEQNDVVSLENQIESLNFIETDENKTEDKNYFKFKMQGLDQIEKGVHCTKGIDMYVTSDRVILLDCQALWSPSFIEETSTNPVTARTANILTVDCLQIASYLMAICHVVIAVQDWFVDYNFIRYIQTAEMLKPSLSASSTVSANPEGSESAGSSENRPHLLLVQNRCQLEDFLSESVNIMQEFYRKAFKRSYLQLNTGIYMYSDSNLNGVNVDSVCKSYNADVCGAPLNLFLLPEVYSDYENRDIYRGHPSFESLAKRLRWMILGVNRHQLTNVPNLSEKSWHQYCSKAWETIRKCTFFMEYERFLT